jgi:CubicO group peptidase (beta-lactamase class C family)
VTTPGLIEDERGEEFGLDPAAVEALADQARRYVDDEELPSLQFAVARHGRLALALAFGNVETRAGVQAANSDTLYAGFSVTKTVVASAAWLLAQDGRLDVKRPVAEIVPEFATNGKEVVTVEQLLTHTAGFPNAPFDPNEWNDIEKRLARFAAWRLDWEPGSRFAYHAMSSMWVVAEIIERSAGKDFREFIRSRIAAPLGLSNLHVGVPAELDDRVANVRFVGTPGATSRTLQRPVFSLRGRAGRRRHHDGERPRDILPGTSRRPSAGRRSDLDADDTRLGKNRSHRRHDRSHDREEGEPGAGHHSRRRPGPDLSRLRQGQLARYVRPPRHGRTSRLG